MIVHFPIGILSTLTGELVILCYVLSLFLRHAPKQLNMLMVDLMDILIDIFST